METRMSKARVELVPGAMQALWDLHGAVAKGACRDDPRPGAAAGQPDQRLQLLRDLHARDLRKAGEGDERIDAVAAWRESPFFTDEERAALALAEAMTLTADNPDPVPDELWDEAADHFSEPELAALLVAIAATNVWNRLNAATKQDMSAFHG